MGGVPPCVRGEYPDECDRGSMTTINNCAWKTSIIIVSIVTMCAVIIRLVDQIVGGAGGRAVVHERYMCMVLCLCRDMGLYMS